MSVQDTRIVPSGDRFEIDVANSTALMLRVRGGVRLDGGFKSAPNGTIALADNAVTYIELAPASGVISGNRSAFTPGAAALYEVTTQGGVVVGIKDWRNAPVLGGAAVAVRAEASALAAGDLVYQSGWSETYGLPLITKADADASGRQAQFVMRSALAQNANGMAFTTWRSAATLNVGGTVGDPVYLDTTAGSWTLTPPSGATANVQIVGRVAVVSGSVGVIAFDVRDFPTIGTNDVQAKAITAALVADATITTTQISATAGITGAQLSASAAIAGTQLAAAAGITGAQLATGAGFAALLAAGLGNSLSYIKTKNDTTDLLAANATKARAVLIVVTVDQTFADNVLDLQPTFSVGEESGAVDKFVTVASLAGKTAGTVQVYGGTLTANKKMQVTGVAASGTGTGTGAISVAVLAIPTT